MRLILGIAVSTMALGLAGASVQQPGQNPAPGSPTPGLNDACGGRSQKPTEACPNDVRKMMALLDLLPAKPPAAPTKPRKVLIFSRIPTGGADAYQHSSIPLAARTIEELGKRTGAWTSTTSWDVNDINAENLKQYDAIFLSSTTGRFLDDSNDPALTAARRAALLDFIRSGKGIAGIHATGDSYHGNAARAAAAASGAAAAPPAGRGAPAGGRAAAPGGGRGPIPPCSNGNPTPGGGGGDPLWPEWDRIIGGYFKFHWSYPTAITVKVDDPANPVNAAFKGRSFNTVDEVYTFNDKSFSRDNVHVLTSIDYSLMTDCDKGLESNPRPDHDYALSWIRREGQGRLFYEALGHHESLYYNNPDLLAHILAGMQYALGDLKADDSPSGYRK
jgi:type 1 glutamine amidotransferase